MTNPSLRRERDWTHSLAVARRRSNIGRALAVILLVLAAAVLGVIIASKFPRPAAPPHVLVISVDGMGSAYYMNPAPGLRTPNLRRLLAEGSYAEAVEDVYPTLTYPAHTTLVTGLMPAGHGIYTNLSSRVAGKNPNDWFWFARDIKAPTLWDEARRHHLTAASVAWPVTAGAGIDWDVPEIWNPARTPAPDAFYVAHFIRPLTLLDVFLALGLPKRGSEDDENRARLACYLITEHRPSLTLLHLEAVDSAEHNHGPGSPEALAALERADVHIGEVLDALKRAGIEGSTDVFVVSDHGFLPIDRQIRPNIPLARAGLLTLNSAGEIVGGKIATVDNDGSFFIYWPGGSGLGTEVEAALQPLLDQHLIRAQFNRNALREMGADPQAGLALEAPDGAEFTDAAIGDLVKPLEHRQGSHGFLPSRPGLQSGFIAWGPDIRAGVDLHRIRLIQIAPTLLEALGIDDPHFGETPPLSEIFKGGRGRDQTAVPAASVKGE
ncbi:MAG TPA: alkaline phosphatase family protein [Terriglobia bacterium]|nr:alkaline phosphatase family protein [Terriglobia bacterium]